LPIFNYGHAEPFSEILVKDGQGNILNKWFWNNWTDESGSFSIELGNFRERFCMAIN
jgi:hypothetical protein